MSLASADSLFNSGLVAYFVGALAGVDFPWTASVAKILEKVNRCEGILETQFVDSLSR